MAIETPKEHENNFPLSWRQRWRRTPQYILYIFILYLIKGCLPLAHRAKQQPSSRSSFINKYTGARRQQRESECKRFTFPPYWTFCAHTHKGCLATLKQARNLGESALAGVINVINSGTESARGLVKWLRPRARSERRGRGHRAIDVAQALLNLWGPLRSSKEREMMCRLMLARINPPGDSKHALAEPLERFETKCHPTARRAKIQCKPIRRQWVEATRRLDSRTPAPATVQEHFKVCENGASIYYIADLCMLFFAFYCYWWFIVCCIYLSCKVGTRFSRAIQKSIYWLLFHLSVSKNLLSFSPAKNFKNNILA